MDAVGAWLADTIAAGRTPGAVWAVAGPDGIVSTGAAGHSAVEPEPVGAALETIYDLASLTKPLVTGLALATLEEGGVLDLDGAASTWLPELAGTAYAEVSLSDLAGHRSGLPAWRPLGAVAGIEAVLAEIAAAPPVERGRVLYSDLGYIALGAVVERAAGRPLDVWFEESVAVPLGLRSIGYPTRLDCSAAAPTERGNVHERRMAGQAGAGIAWREALIRGEPHDGNAYALGGVAGHAGLFGAVDDVLAVAREILEPDAGVLGEAARSRLLSEVVPGAGRTSGFVLARASGAASGVLPDTAPGHVGFSGTSLWLEPDVLRAYVLLTNRVHPVVHDEDFQPVRLRFHREARGLF